MFCSEKSYISQTFHLSSYHIPSYIIYKKLFIFTLAHCLVQLSKSNCVFGYVLTFTCKLNVFVYVVPWKVMSNIFLKNCLRKSQADSTWMLRVLTDRRSLSPSWNDNRFSSGFLVSTSRASPAKRLPLTSAFHFIISLLWIFSGRLLDHRAGLIRFLHIY